MKITIFGTCRFNNLEHNQLNHITNYPHSTKETIQLIRFLKGGLVFPSPYNRLCFRTGIVERKNIEYSAEFNKRFNETDLFILEICSKKKYIHNNFYLHNLCVDTRKEVEAKFRLNTPQEVLDNFIIEKQTDEEIENDLLEIQKMLYPKKIIVVSHYNAKRNGEYMPDRAHLINLLDTLCKKHTIPFVNPSIVLEHLPQHSVFSPDLGHYTRFGIQVFTDYMADFIKKSVFL
jgi:hypothetical protein